MELTAGVLDQILEALTGGLTTGFASLYAYALPLFGVLALIRFRKDLLMLVVQLDLGALLFPLIMLVLTIGVWLWLLTNWKALMDALLQTFVFWGAAVGGQAFTVEDFLHPSRIMDAGQVAAAPIWDLIQRNSGWATVLNMHVLWLYWLGWLAVVSAYAGMSLLVLVALFEWHLALLISPVLIPFGILSQTSLFCELSMSWLMGSAVRMLVMSATMSLGIPLFARTLAFPEGQDPGIYEAVICAVVAIMFWSLTWLVSKRAASFASRGMSLALGSEVYMPMGRAVLQVAPAAVRGVSQIMRAI